MINDRPPGSVRVVVPNESSTIIVASGVSFPIEIEPDSTRVVYLLPDDARLLLNSGLPCAVLWKEANMQLAANLGAPPKVEPGLHIASYLQALEASRPLHPKDIRGTLRELGRLPR